MLHEGSGQGVAADVLVFDVRASLARFRRPDTTQTQATYPFITRTASRGLLASILGLDAWDDFDDLAGVRLLAPVRTSVQRMSMLNGDFFGGAKKKGTFNLPTSVEWVVAPHYRIYYAGKRSPELAAMIGQRKSVYHTYLGVAEALCQPRLVGVLAAEQVMPTETTLTCASVVPAHTIRRVLPAEGSALARSGALSRSVVPVETNKASSSSSSGGGSSRVSAPTHSRRFSGSIELIYDRDAQEVSIEREPEPVGGYSPPATFVRLEASEEVVCLW